MTTPRAIRIPDDLWAAALTKSKAEGGTVTSVVLDALRAYTGQGPTVDDLRYVLAWMDKETRAEFRRDPDGERIWAFIK